MAIRKIRKNMKIPITIFVVAFVLTILATFFISLGDLKNNKNYVLLINKEKVSAVNISRTFEQGLSQYRQTFQDGINEEEIKVLILDDFINNILLAQSAKDLGIRVSSREVNEQFKAFRSQFQSKDAYGRFLQFQGYTQNSLKEEIKKSLLIEKVVEKLNNSAQTDEAEIREYFEVNKYEKYIEKDINEVRGEIEEALLSNKNRQAYAYFLENLKDKAVLQWTEDEQGRYYQQYESKIVYEVDSYKFSNVELIGRKMMLERIKLMYGLKDLEVSMDTIKEDIDKEVRKAISAKRMGITPKDNLAKLDEIYYLGEKLRIKLISEEKIEEAEIKEYFEKNIEKYNVNEMASINIIELEAEMSQKTKAEKYEKASKILEKLNSGENFAKMAMAHSDCPSSAQGGQLGWFSKGQMVPEFEEAVFKGDIGLYPEIVETRFGYHIIKIEDKKDNEANASHILVQFNVGIEDVENTKLEAEKLVKQITAGEINFMDLAKERSVFPRTSIENITRLSHPQQIGLSQDIITEVFNSKSNILQVKTDGNRVFIIERTKYRPYEKAELSNVLDRVRHDIAREKVTVRMEQISIGLE